MTILVRLASAKKAISEPPLASILKNQSNKGASDGCKWEIRRLSRFLADFRAFHEMGPVSHVTWQWKFENTALWSLLVRLGFGSENSS